MRLRIPVDSTSRRLAVATAPRKPLRAAVQVLQGRLQEAGGVALVSRGILCSGTRVEPASTAPELVRTRMLVACMVSKSSGSGLVWAGRPTASATHWVLHALQAFTVALPSTHQGNSSVVAGMGSDQTSSTRGQGATSSRCNRRMRLNTTCSSAPILERKLVTSGLLVHSPQSVQGQQECNVCGRSFQQRHFRLLRRGLQQREHECIGCSQKRKLAKKHVEEGLTQQQCALSR